MWRWANNTLMHSSRAHFDAPERTRWPSVWSTVPSHDCRDAKKKKKKKKTTLSTSQWTSMWTEYFQVQSVFTSSALIWKWLMLSSHTYMQLNELKEVLSFKFWIHWRVKQEELDQSHSLSSVQCVLEVNFKVRNRKVKFNVFAFLNLWTVKILYIV